MYAHVANCSRAYMLPGHFSSVFKQCLKILKNKNVKIKMSMAIFLEIA